jgi:ABC-type uncharacterized transport system substrate-binding protein
MKVEPMRRREFITLLGGAAAAWPMAVRAQQRAMPVVGVLYGVSAAEWASRIAEFRRGLSELGFVEGRSVAFEYRWAEGRFDRVPAMAADLVSRKVAVILVGGGNVGVRAVMAATQFRSCLQPSRTRSRTALLPALIVPAAMSPASR